MNEEALIYIAQIVIYFTVGFSVGWIARGFKEKYPVNLSGLQTEKVMSIVVTGAYVLSVIVDMISPAYETPLGLHTIMGLIVGYYFKKGVVKDEN